MSLTSNATLEIVSTTSSSVTFKIANLHPTYDQGIRVVTVYLYKNGEDETSDWFSFNLPILISESGTYSFSDLESNTSYIIKCNIEVPNAGLVYLDDVTFDTSGGSSSSSRPENWKWEDDEWDAFNNHGLISTITWSRWNEFVDRVGKFVDYYYGKDTTEADHYQDYLINAHMTETDRFLTATRFNNVRRTIGSMYSTDIDMVYKGDIVYGHYFVTMTNSLNSIQ